MSKQLDEKDQYLSPQHHEEVLVDSTLEGDNKEVLASDFGQYIAGESALFWPKRAALSDCATCPADASDETKRQKTQTVAEAIRMYRPGIIYSLIFSAAIIMEGL